MGLLPEKVYKVCQVLYGLFLLFGTVWNLKRLYDDDRDGRSFQSGRSRTAIVIVVCAILLFPFLVPETVYHPLVSVFGPGDCLPVFGAGPVSGPASAAFGLAGPSQ